VAPISAASSQLASHRPNLRIPVDQCHHVTLGQALRLCYMDYFLAWATSSVTIMP
jgi:hypothetical protein